MSNLIERKKCKQNKTKQNKTIKSIIWSIVQFQANWLFYSDSTGVARNAIRFCDKWSWTNLPRNKNDLTFQFSLRTITDCRVIIPSILSRLNLCKGSIEAEMQFLLQIKCSCDQVRIQFIIVCTNKALKTHYKTENL